MKDDTTIIPFRQPSSIIDPLTEIARDGARRMLMAALKAEADGFVAQFSEDRLGDGRQRVVRHGAGPGDPDRDRPDRGSAPTGARPCDGPARRGEDPFYIQYPAEVGATLAEPQCPLAGALSARHFHRRSGIPSDRWQSCPHSRRRSVPFSARMRQTCRLASSRASTPVGRRNTTAGRAVICRRAATSPFGRMGFTCRRGWNPKPSASS